MEEQADDSLVLRDLVPAEPLLPDPSLPAWVWFALALATIVAVGALVFFLRRAKKPVPEDPQRLRAEAYAAARKELDAPPLPGIQAAATRVSLVLRRYLATISRDPALFETHEEFIARHAALSGYPEEVRQATAEGFSHLARLKYGREANGDPAALYSDAIQLLDRLHQHPPA